MILVVDDHQDESEVLVRLLQRSGYLAEAVDDGPTALRFLEHIRPEAVLLDVMMPGMDGIEVLRLIRQDALCGDVPVVIFSADGTERRQQDALRFGANGFLVKGRADWYDLRTFLDQLVKPPRQTAPAATPA